MRRPAHTCYSDTGKTHCTCNLRKYKHAICKSTPLPRSAVGSRSRSGQRILATRNFVLVNEKGKHLVCLPTNLLAVVSKADDDPV